MRRLVATHSAKRDFDAIIKRITRSWGQIGTARSFGRGVLDRCARLAALPVLPGVHRPEYGNGARATFHRQPVAIFHFQPGRLLLLRIVEGHRNLVDHLEDGGN